VIDPDRLLKGLVQWAALIYYNLFANLDTEEHHACPVSSKATPHRIDNRAIAK
jgi:hypothetical protein